ncbi:unnamed protein product [Knipowitschia caucasica]|uniref:Uncharacterized protein n=1 Tax=Knipowitschia caucasica TaxID=637954 RepID=A0AAV2KB85_KNICA
MAVRAILTFIALLSIYNAKYGESQYVDPVPFPPAPPTSANVGAICSYGNYGPRYPDNSIPRSWSSHSRRRAAAINRLESGYQLCCNKTPVHTKLSCAYQAWMESLSQFCVEEFSTMTVAYHCCRVEDTVRWSCFYSSSRQTHGY